MTEYVTAERGRENPVGREAYSAPQLVDMGVVSEVTLGKYAEDSADKGRYFE